MHIRQSRWRTERRVECADDDLYRKQDQPAQGQHALPVKDTSPAEERGEVDDNERPADQDQRTMDELERDEPPGCPTSKAHRP